MCHEIKQNKTKREEQQKGNIGDTLSLAKYSENCEKFNISNCWFCAHKIIIEYNKKIAKKAEINML